MDKGKDRGRDQCRDLQLFRGEAERAGTGRLTRAGLRLSLLLEGDRRTQLTASCSSFSPRDSRDMGTAEQIREADSAAAPRTVLRSVTETQPTETEMRTGARRPFTPRPGTRPARRRQRPRLRRGQAEDGEAAPARQRGSEEPIAW